MKHTKWPVQALIAMVLVNTLFLTGCWKPAPIKTSFRRSALDSSGLVLQVQNTSGHRLSCKMTAKNKTLNQRVNYAFDLGPYSITEIGLLETNWTFRMGESVEIEVEGFSGKSFKVP